MKKPDKTQPIYNCKPGKYSGGGKTNDEMLKLGRNQAKIKEQGAVGRKRS